MALIDITELYVDPDFVDDLILVHRIASVNSLGENVLSQTQAETIGSVQPASGKTLQRLPEEYRVANVYTFWLRGEIVADGKSKYPDLIIFQGQSYAVQTIQDWTNWGTEGGWSEGTAVRMAPAL